MIKEPAASKPLQVVEYLITYGSDEGEWKPLVTRSIGDSLVDNLAVLQQMQASHPDTSYRLSTYKLESYQTMDPFTGETTEIG